jgi:hypothetical protein
MASSVEMVLGVDITVGSCVCARGWKAEVYDAASLKRVAHARWGGCWRTPSMVYMHCPRPVSLWPMRNVCDAALGGSLGDREWVVWSDAYRLTTGQSNGPKSHWE